MYSTLVTEPQRTRVKIGAGAFVEKKTGEFLLEKRRDNGMWRLPGGAVYPGETLEKTVIREIEEETGLIVEITGFLGIYSDPQDGRIVCYLDNGDLVHIIDVIFTASVVSGSLRVSSESFEVRFFSRHKLPENIVLPAIRPIHDYLSGKRCQIRWSFFRSDERHVKKNEGKG
jgi:ADP-ribose pyrophosphatase YjhB (NUDIX family)